MAGFSIQARLATVVAAALVVSGVVMGASPIPAQALTGTQVVGPPGSSLFGENVLVLSNGNYVVADPKFDGPALETGAVYLYDGATNEIISTLTGSTANDYVGDGGITEVGESNFVIVSSSWDNGLADDAGAVTWVDGTTGLDGVVSPANSLVGSSSQDLIGLDGVTVLENGNYVVASSMWNRVAPAASEAGAVTWGDGTAGISGPVTAANSLVGGSANDSVGLDGVTALTNGNYVVASGDWHNGGSVSAGAATWGNGTGGTVGAVSASNSLVGSSTGDFVGTIASGNGVTALTNGNYVVASDIWDNGPVSDAGAVTWGNGAGGTVGAVAASNSLIGGAEFANVGNGGVTALTNNNYVVASPLWDAGLTIDVGAVTWGNGSGPTSDTVGSGNSLVGAQDSDNVGSGGVTALSNGNYVVASPSWDDATPTTDVGAVTWRKRQRPDERHGRAGQQPGRRFRLGQRGQRWRDRLDQR